MTIEFLEHTGDAAARITAADGAELLSEAARALLSVTIDAERSEPVLESEVLPLDLEAADGESLLVAFLGELIFLFDTRRFLCASARLEEVTLGAPARARGVIRGERFDELRHVFLTEVKAATYHALEIRETGGRLEVVVVFDL